MKSPTTEWRTILVRFENPTGFSDITKIVRHSAMRKIRRILRVKLPPHRGLSAQIHRICAEPASRLGPGRRPKGDGRPRPEPVLSLRHDPRSEAQARA